MSIDISLIAAGDVFSETSHYIAKGRSAELIQFEHVETGRIVSLGNSYVADLLLSADQFTETKVVGKEDKYWTPKQITEAVAKGELAVDHTVREGDLRVKGIRTIFEEIYDGKVFKAVFQKKDTKMTAKKFKELRDAQIAEALAEIEKVATQKKGVKNASSDALRRIQDNPIFETVPGEMRTLNGYKIQFKSRDGHYDCIDLDLPKDDSNKRIRQVNINTLKELVVDGVKYVVEK